MEVYGFVVFCIYLAVLAYIIPTKWLSFDLYERKFRLLPSWFKFVSVAWLLVSLVFILIEENSIQKWDELLLSNFNVSLFIFFFSKQKNEDEFSEQIRFKAFTYSFVSFVALFGALGAMKIRATNEYWNNFILHGFFGGGLLIATLYFYFTIYKLRKENN